MRVTLRRRKGDRTRFVQSRLGSIPVDYSRMEGLVEIVHVEIPDEDAKPPRSAVTIAKNVAREARRAGLIAKTAEPGRTRTLRLRDWPDTCEGLGIGTFEPPRVLKPRGLRGPDNGLKCTDCGGPTRIRTDGPTAGLSECSRACLESTVKRVDADAGEAMAVKLDQEILGEAKDDYSAAIQELADAMERTRKALERVRVALFCPPSTPRS